ncbi:MAG: RHS repeat-associated core domain-containing protein [Parachlamydiaceae bacterium]
MLKIFFNLAIYLFCLNGYCQELSSNPFELTYLGDPTSVVAGCVNVISGDYFDVQRDLFMHGGSPLIVERSYTSSDQSQGIISHGWHLNFEGTIDSPRSYRGPHGSILSFNMFGEYLIRKGVTNNSNGLISGRTNLKNTRLYQNPENPYLFTLQQGDGSKSFFSLWGDYPKIIAHHKANGMQDSFQYLVDGSLSGVKMINLNQAVLQSISLKATKNDSLILKTNDQRAITYQLDRLRYKFSTNQEITTWQNCRVNDSWREEIRREMADERLRHERIDRKDYTSNFVYYVERIYLTKVKRPNAPNEKYLYETIKESSRNQYRRVIQKSHPDNRFLNISYYGVNHPWKGRVESLSGPIGTDATPLPMYQFQYHGVKKYTLGGSCSVYNALGHRTDYKWDADNRLDHSVRYYQGEPYLINKVYWGKEDDHGNLRSRILCTRSEIFLCKCYRYDKRGNVLTEALYGNLSGHNHNPLVMDDSGVPIETGCERIEKEYEYSVDERNLVLSEQQGERSKEFVYYEGTDRVAIVYTLYQGKIILRNSFTYDENACVELDVLDDGCSLDLNDFTGVTYRRIKKHTNNRALPFGLPIEIEETVYDIKTQQEHLVKLIKNNYSIEGNLIKQELYDSTRALAYTLEWDYNSKGQVVREVNALGHVIVKHYDRNGNLLSEVGPKGDFRKDYVYDFSNRLCQIKETHPDNVLTTQFRYDLLGRKIAAIDHYGNETNYVYDELDRIVEVMSPSVLDENGVTYRPTHHFSYDALGNVTEKIDPQGNCTSTVYNIRRQPVRIAYPDGTTEHFRYHLLGHLASKVDRNGCVTNYEYDYFDRLVSTTCYDSTGNFLWKTSAFYNAFHLMHEVDAAGVVTYYQYDAFGRKVSMIKGDRHEEFAYDSLGRVSKKIVHYGDHAADVVIKCYCYDALDRVIEERTEDYDGACLELTRCRFDQLGKQIEVVSYGEKGANSLQMIYNSYGLPYRTIDAYHRVTEQTQSFSFQNELGQFVSYQEKVDPLGNIFVTIKDALGRDVEWVNKNALGDVLQRKKAYYDRLGNQAKIIETVYHPEKKPYDITHKWSYDSMKRVVACYEAFGEPEQMSTSYTYNEKGQLAEIVKNNGVVIYHTYTPEGLLATFFSSDHSFHYEFEYDVKNNLIASYDRIHHQTTKRAYNSHNQVIFERLGNGGSLHFSYDGMGRISSMVLPDQSSIEYVYNSAALKEVRRYSKSRKERYRHIYETYDLALKPLRQTLLGKAGTLETFYDLKGRVSSNKTAFTEETVPEDGYNSLDQIIKKETKDVLGKMTLTYQYDDLGQLIDEKGNSNHTYQFDSAYNLVAKDGKSISHNHLNQIVDDQFTYDLSGRLVSSPEGLFTYDALDRLIAFEKDGKKASYTYDSFNRRLSKTIGSQTWHYLYAEQNEIGCFNPSGTIKELRVLGIGRGAEIGAAVAIELGGEVYAPIHDMSGNVTTLISEKGKVVESYRFTAFGEETLKQKPKNPWRFSSKRHDKESKLVNFGRRYYSPSLARWMTRDPLAYQAGPNLYAYVSNNPLMCIDLYGLIAEETMEKVTETANKVAETVRDVVEYVRESIEYVVSTIREGCERAREFIRDSFDRASSFADRVVTSVKEFTSQLYNLNPLPSYPKSFFGVTDYFAVHIAGQGNDGLSCEVAATAIAIMGGGMNMDYLVNQSGGLISDTLHSLNMIMHSKCSVNFDKVQLATSCLRQALEKAGDKEIVATAHSQGSLILYYALKNLDSDERARIKVYTFGAAKIIPTDDLKECRNYISPFDPIPFVADFFGIIKSLFSNNYRVEFLKPGMPLMDHAIMQGPYKNKLVHIFENR